MHEKVVGVYTGCRLVRQVYIIMTRCRDSGTACVLLSLVHLVTLVSITCFFSIQVVLEK